MKPMDHKPPATIVGDSQVFVYSSREAMGYFAAQQVIEKLRRVISVKGTVRMMVGCAPSQDEFFDGLIEQTSDADELWSKVTLFHMDDYVGLTADHPQSFRRYLYQHLLNYVTPKQAHLISGEAEDLEAEASRYGALLEDGVDVICLGFGENGHVAFNDPPVAQFDDPYLVKIVTLDTACRQQQVNDGCFPSIEAVPMQALTATLPVFIKAGFLSAVVPGERKAQAVCEALTGPFTTNLPASLVIRHKASVIHLDAGAASLLPKSFLKSE